jgi:hypothetical protein
MKLLAFKINNVPITNIINWSISELNGNKAFLVSDVDIQNYEDVSSIFNWDTYGNKIKDFNYVKDRIKELTDQIGFGNLTTGEKIISAKYFVVDKTDRDSVLTEDEQYEYWKILIIESQKSRFLRWEEAKKYISYKLSPINSSDLAKSTSELCNDYINYNIITKSKDGISGLFDYLKGEGDYVSNGYPSKIYWTQNDQDKLMDILNNGNY